MKYAGSMAAIYPPGDAVRDVVAKKRNIDMTTTMRKLHSYRLAQPGRARLARNRASVSNTNQLNDV